MYPSDINLSHARERYNDQRTVAIAHAQVHAAQAAETPAAQPVPADSRIARLLDSLRPRRPARA